MRISIRWPAPSGQVYSQEDANAMVGARMYVGIDRTEEIGFVVNATRFNRGTVVVLECELHDPANRLIAEMRSFHLGQSLLS